MCESILCFRFSGRLCRPFLFGKVEILRVDKSVSNIVFTGEGA